MPSGKVIEAAATTVAPPIRSDRDNLKLFHVQAPESFHDMSVTDLVLGTDPRRPSQPARRTWALKPNMLTGRMDKIAKMEIQRDALRNREYLLHRLKKNDRFVRRPACTDDHITRASRLIEAERITCEVDEALRTVKDGFAAEMDRCGRRKDDAVRKTTALMEAMHDFSDFVATNDHWIKHNTDKSLEDERGAQVYVDERARLLIEQEVGLKKRTVLRSKKLARKEYKSLLDEIVALTAGDFNGTEHLITELEQQIAVMTIAQEAVEQKEQIEAEAESFRKRLNALEQMAAKEKILLTTKAKMLASKRHYEEMRNLLSVQQEADVQEYLNLQNSIYEIYTGACSLIGQERKASRKEFAEQFCTIGQCLLDSYIVQTAVNHVFAKNNPREGKEIPNQKLEEVTGLVGSGFFPHLTFKVLLKPLPLIRPQKNTLKS
ncbi:hypothetical protein BV898_10603 [Hypsibius exemplaris]|uniref:Uncharacterized protein n=1 Tax=Hypsibius exemplaris TaxID=2072580 RepID=A0A1W0WJ23_HYPEX|nr:hypothetical protein BV898_10603 [Hypsibius exemplaris]